MPSSTHADTRQDEDESISPTATLNHTSNNTSSGDAFVEDQTQDISASQHPAVGSATTETLVEDDNGASDKDSDLKAPSQKDEPITLKPMRSESIGPDVVPSGSADQTGINRTASQLESVHATGASNFFNPTNVRMRVKFHRHHNIDDSEANQPHAHEYLFQWRARDQRKGRNASIVSSDKKYTPPLLSRIFSMVKEIAQGILLMVTTFPYWNMAFWSGWSYTIGSILFVMDGAWAWEPIAFPGSEFEGEDEYGVPLLFFFGALLYQLGATVAYLEAINDGSFAGSAMKRFLEGHENEQKMLLDEKLHTFFGHVKPHRRHKNEEEKVVDPEAGWGNMDTKPRSLSTFPAGVAPAPRRGGIDYGPTEEGQMTEYQVWRWWPTWSALIHHHLRDLGYIACTIQLIGATMYGVAGVVILPGLLSSLNRTQELFAYWIPQVVASVGFLTAGIMFTLETQDKWYKPTPHLLGWWIGAWATVGSVGFLLCAVFGIPSSTYSWCAYQSDLASMWGSAGYLLSSLLQWYEAVNKGPVLAFPNTNP